MIHLEKVMYTAKAHTMGGRDGGASRTDDGRLDVRFAPPGGASTGTNPEQLFAVGWSACFLSAVKFMAHKMKVVLSRTWPWTPRWTSAQRAAATRSRRVLTSVCRALNAKPR